MNELSAVNVFAVVRSAELGEALTSAMGSANGTAMELRVGELKTMGAQIACREKPDVLILDIDAEDPHDMDVLNQIKRSKNFAATSVVATATKITTSGIRRLLRDGIDDFLPQPLVQTDVIDAIKNANKKRNAASDSPSVRQGHIFSFLKASGGMGATTLAVQSACSLAHRSGATAGDVCLIDLDVQFGNAALSLDLECGPGLIDIVRSPDRLEGELLRAATVQHKSGLSVLTAPNVPMPLEVLSPQVASRLLDVARQEYAHVVVDLARALASWTDTILTKSDCVFLVTQPTVPAIRQTRRLLDLLHEEGHYALPLRIVLNRHTKKWGSRVDLAQAEKALGRKLDHTISNEYELVISALNQGVPVSEIKRRSKFGSEIVKMVEAEVTKVDQRRAGEA